MISGSSTKAQKSDLNNEEHFRGVDNPLVYTRFYDLTFNCQFELQNYPFDYQVCSIQVLFLVYSCLII